LQAKEAFARGPEIHDLRRNSLKTTAGSASWFQERFFSMIVREIMVSPVITVPEDCSLTDAARLMLECHIGCLPVVNEKAELSGIVTDSDFVAKEKGLPFSLSRFPRLLGEWLPKEGAERIYKAAGDTAVREIMSSTVITLTEEDTLETVLERMLQTGLHRLPVVKDRKPVGIVARHDLLRLLLKRMPGAQQR